MKLHPVIIAKEFKAYPFFASFNEALILQVATIANVKSFEAGDYILRNGDINDSIYFLRSGSVEILLDGELIAELSESGEVLGEMSVISKLPATADIYCPEKVECFYISLKDFAYMNPRDIDEIQYLIYRVYCIVLTHRLRMTNQKARQFEIANRELRQAQEELKNITLSKVNEVEQAKELAFEKLKTLSQEMLEKLNLVSVVNLYKSEKAIQSKKVLLIESNKKQQVIAKMALGGTGVLLDIATDLIQADEFLEKNKYDLIICDAELSEALKFAQDRNMKCPTVLLTDIEMSTSFGIIENNPQVNCVVSRDLEDRAFTIKNNVTTVTKILNKDIFGLDKYLAWGADIQSRLVESSDQRAPLIEQMETHFKSIGVRSQILDRIKVSAEEILMNAIYDAPTSADGKPLYNHLPRTQKIELKPEQQPHFKFACDGIWLAVSVTDPFGSLEKQTVVKYLQSIHQGKAGELNQTKGGAGRGLHMLIESADLTVFNVSPGKKTEVISMINLENVAQKKETKPTFHFFSMEAS